jgi:hypothetical protein
MKKYCRLKMYCFLKSSSFFILVVLITFTRAEFELEFLGNYVSEDEEKSRDFCESKYCAMDTNELLYAATQNASVDPCVDFKEFALGIYIKFRALNDRYEFNGFQSDMQKAHIHRQKTVLAAEIDKKNDTRIFKVMKNFYQKCIDAGKCF